MSKFQVSWVKSVVQMCEVEAETGEDAIDEVFDHKHNEIVLEITSDPPTYDFHFAVERNADTPVLVSPEDEKTDA